MKALVQTTRLVAAAAVAAGVLAVQGCVKDKDNFTYPPQRDFAVPTPDKAVKYINETFDEVAKVDGQMAEMPEGWTNLPLAGIRTYQTAVQARKDGRTFRGLLGTGYLSNDTVNDIWLILPPIITSDTTRYLTLETGCTYSATGTTLSLLYSSTYEGGTSAIDPAQWQKLADLGTQNTSSGPVIMTATPKISLRGLGGQRQVVYVAVRYFSKVSLEAIATENADRANYYIDNINYQ